MEIDMTTATYTSLTEQEKRQVRMFGCTEAQMREAIEESLTFRFTGPGMMAMSILSDAQEMINTEYGEIDYMRAEDSRQAINRAKWIISTYLMKE